MIPEQKQTELQRHRDILLATIDYQLARQRGAIVFDKVDWIVEHWEQERLKVEKYYAGRRLSNLQKMLTHLTGSLQNRTDLNFEGYIKEKTGYEIDLFGDVRIRVDAIITQNKIRNQQELNDVNIMARYYRQTSADATLAERLQELSMNYHLANREKQTGYTETTRTINKDGVELVKISHTTGPKPKHLVEEEAISPDGKRRLRLVQWGDGKNASTFVTIIFPTASGGIYSANGIHPGVKVSWKDNTTIVIELPKGISAHTQHKEARSFEDVIAFEYVEY